MKMNWLPVHAVLVSICTHCVEPVVLVKVYESKRRGCASPKIAHVVVAGQVCGIPLRNSRSVCVGSPVAMLPLITIGVQDGLLVGDAVGVGVGVPPPVVPTSR